VRFYYFFDPKCGSCHETHVQVVEPLLAEYGERVEITELDISESANMELMLLFEDLHGVAAGDIPEIVIGEHILVGAFDIEDHLRQRIEEYLALGGVDLPLPVRLSADASPAPSATASCDECGDTHAASRTAIAENKAQLDKPVRALLFWSETCPHCHTVLEEILPVVYARYGDVLAIRAIEVSGRDNSMLWWDIAQQVGVPQDRMYIPMLIMGDQAVIGSDPIAEALPGLIERYRATGGVDYVRLDLPDGVAPLYQAPPVVSVPEPIHAVYFYQPGCDECERSEHDLRYIQDKYPQVLIERFNVKEQAAFNQYLCQETGVPEDKHLTAPALFIGRSYLLADGVRARPMEGLIEPLLANGSPAWWVGWEAQQAQVEEAIVSRFQSFGLLTVVGAGLIDGVNPCAFATMIFLISYLSINKRKGRQLLLTGGAFTLGVFLTYLGVGFGFLRFLASLPFLNAIGKWIYGLTAILCLALAWGSVADYRKARAGRLHDMGLTLPDSLRELSKKLIRQGTSAKRFVLSAFLLGIGVSLVELACTGQVYLPTIIYVLGIPALRARASLALLLYNLMFIVPLVGVFVLVYYGTTSAQLVEWLNRRAATVKLGMAVLFLALAGWLIYSIVAL
jgi:cytochrome c biogenesis protein CcdA/thiol-disulfide isomerase/thioredoxin